MQQSEVRAFARLSGQAAGGVAGWAEELNQVVAARAFWGFGGLGAPVRMVHDSVSARVCAAVRGLAGAVGETGGSLLAPNRRLDRCERATFPSTSHQSLLNDRRIAEALVGWLA